MTTYTGDHKTFVDSRPVTNDTINGRYSDLQLNGTISNTATVNGYGNPVDLNHAPVNTVTTPASAVHAYANFDSGTHDMAFLSGRGLTVEFNNVKGSATLNMAGQTNLGANKYHE